MKKNIAISIMAFTFAAATFAGCGQQNAEPATETASETETVSEIEESVPDAEETVSKAEETEAIEESAPDESDELSVGDTSDRPEIVSQEYRIVGDLADYTEYFYTDWDGEQFNMLVTNNVGAVTGSNSTFDFENEVFEFNGLTQNDTPEDYLYKCVELFGMPECYSVVGTERYATWYFYAPDPDAKYDSTAGPTPYGKTVMFLLTLCSNNPDYQMAMHVEQTITLDGVIEAGNAWS